MDTGSVLSTMAATATFIRVVGGKELLQTVYADLAQPSIRKMGQALGMVFDFGINCFSYFGEKQAIFFTKHLKDYAEKLNEIPEEKIIEVPPAIGIPIMQRLANVTDDSIASLFIELLTKASSSDTIELTHPRFITILENISIDEAKLIIYMKDHRRIPYFKVLAANSRNEAIELYKPITALDIILSNLSSPLVFRQNLWIYFDNFVSLGILEDYKQNCLADNKYYDEIESLFGNKEYFIDKTNPGAIGGKAFFIDKCKSDPRAQGKTITFPRGYYKVTELGEKFIEVCTQSNPRP